jgi:hypothetical protein
VAPQVLTNVDHCELFCCSLSERLTFNDLVAMDVMVVRMVLDLDDPSSPILISSYSIGRDLWTCRRHPKGVVR